MVVVDGQAQAAIQHSNVQANVDVLSLLPLQVRIRSRLSGNDGLDGRTAEHRGLAQGANEIGRRVLVDITLQTVAGT